MECWLKLSPKGSLLALYIQPGAKSSEVAGLHGERLKIRIKGAPVDGEANQELIHFLSESLGLTKREVVLVSGETSRQKSVLVSLPPDEVMRLLKF